jgi:hypothetical protein
VRRVHGQPYWYRVIRDIDPIALPGRLCTALTRAPAPTQPSLPLLPSSRRRDAYVQAALRDETATVAQAVPGSRAHTLFRCAVRLGELVGAGALDETPPSRRCWPQHRSPQAPASSPATKPSDTSPTASPAADATPAHCSCGSPDRRTRTTAQPTFSRSSVNPVTTPVTMPQGFPQGDPRGRIPRLGAHHPPAAGVPVDAQRSAHRRGHAAMNPTPPPG